MCVCKGVLAVLPGQAPISVSGLFPEPLKRPPAPTLTLQSALNALTEGPF